MKVKFLMNGMGNGFSYFEGDEGVIHNEAKAKELIDKGVCKEIKEEVKEVKQLIPTKKRRRRR